jgi:hypothetical protein
MKSSPPSKAPRGEISAADALTAEHALRPRSPDGYRAIAVALDLLVAEDALASRRTRRRRTRVETPEPVVEPATPAEAPEAGDRVGTVIGARMRVEEEPDEAPEWLATADRIALPTGGGTVPPEPPLPSLKARAAMATVAATRRPSRRLDVPELVRRAARLKPLTPLPLVEELRTAPVVQLLDDRGEGMEPYVQDVRFLVRQIMDVAGRDRVERHTFVRTPLDGVDPDPFSESVKRWKPIAGALVIAITDLGVGGPFDSPDRGTAREWRRVADTAARHGGVLRVLTPFGPDVTPAVVDELADVLSWDGLDELVRLRG